MLGFEPVRLAMWSKGSPAASANNSTDAVPRPQLRSSYRLSIETRETLLRAKASWPCPTERIRVIGASRVDDGGGKRSRLRCPASVVRFGGYGAQRAGLRAWALPLAVHGGVGPYGEEGRSP